jgi:hypothetical protein
MIPCELIAGVTLQNWQKIRDYKNIDFVNEKYDLLILKSDVIVGVGFSFFFKGMFFLFHQVIGQLE